MCGIIGLISFADQPFTRIEIQMVKKAIGSLFKSAEMRGRDATGIALLTNEKLFLFKDDVPASQFILTKDYNDIIDKISNSDDKFKVILGHTRYETKGTHKLNINNHPILSNRIIGIHNGVISNDDELFARYGNIITRQGQVDSEIIFRLIDMYRKDNKSLIESVTKTAEQLHGSCASAFLDIEAPDYITLFTSNSTNLHILFYNQSKFIIFGSTFMTLKNALANNILFSPQMSNFHLNLVNSGTRIDLRNGKRCDFSLQSAYMVS